MKSKCLFIATDGDPCYNSFHETQFTKLFKIYCSLGLQETIENIGLQTPFWVADWLHLFKNIRNRMLKYSLCLTFKKISAYVDPKIINDILNLGPVFSDFSAIGRMRDIYPIALFRLEYVIELFSKNKIAEALYLAPVAFFIFAIRSAIISDQTRIYLLQITFELFMIFYDEYIRNSKKLTENGPSDIHVHPFKLLSLIRTCNTVLAYIWSIQYIDSNFPLDRLSTHPTENFFGNLRRICNDSNTFQDILHFTARNQVVQECISRIQYPSQICGRENLGGVVTLGEDGLTLITEIPPKDIAFSLFTLFEISYQKNKKIEEEELGRIEIIMKWMQNLKDDGQTSKMAAEKCFSIRASSNSKIISELLQDSIVKKQKK
jgi:hypothetical protein